MKRRVVITGLGPVSTIGTGVDAFESGLRTGRCGGAPIGSFDATGFPHYFAAEVADFRPEAHLRFVRPDEWGRAAQFAAAAARLAVEDAALVSFDPNRAGAVVGTTSGESQVMEQLAAQVVAGGFGATSSVLFERLPAARLAYAVSEELALEGESVTLSTACAASNYAIGYAYDALVSGRADLMFAGGSDAVCRWAHAGFYRLGALAEKACSPFDRDRAGILVGEGGAIVLLETLDHASKRGARVYAEVLGYASNCDASHMVSPDAPSIARCMRLAHERAGISPGDVDYISAHGTGTPANDLVETSAIREVFGEETPPTSSIKSMLGHAMGAASGFGAIASALAIARGFLPPTVNWSTPDPHFDWVDPVPNVARPARVDVAQNNGFAFGGNNAIVVLGRVA